MDWISSDKFSGQKKSRRKRRQQEPPKEISN